MEISKEAIIERTHYGIKVYAHVLRKYYTDEVVLRLSGRQCKPAKNPFNGDKVTLHVVIVGGAAMHYDGEVDNCKGDAFDFAALHYQLEGEALLSKLNEELGLRIGCAFDDCNSTERVVRNEGDVFPHFPQIPQKGKSEGIQKGGSEGSRGGAIEGNKKEASEGVQKDQSAGYKKGDHEGGDVPRFSFFKKPIKNTIPSRSTSLVEVYQKIKGVSYQKRTNALRALQDEKAARAYKAEQFDYVTFSGLFTKRENSALVQHSGLFAVDFDHLEDVDGLKQRLLLDPYFETALLFVSPSGHGLKWVVPIDITKATHQQYAIGLSNYLLHNYGQKMDASGKDIARACFLPHDPNIYIHPKYL